jgi:hypothetical protein
MREALGDEYPELLDANSFVTLSELQRHTRDLRAGELIFAHSRRSRDRR